MKTLEKHSTSTPEAIQADARKLVRFVSMYCRAHHSDREKATFTFEHARLPVRLTEHPALCAPCERLLRHAIVKRVQCPLDPKPKCRHCPEHCYRPAYREQMETVMKYAGPRSLFSRG